MRRNRFVGTLAAVAGASLMLAGSVSAQSPAVTPGAGAGWKIGVVADIGSINDKNFNEYSYKGAVNAATALGAAKPGSIVPSSASEYVADIQQFVNDNYDLIVTVGFNLASATTQAAHDNPNIWFVGVDQSPICVDATGAPDAGNPPTCAGDAATLLPNYVSFSFEEDQAGYLAGIVAASLSKSGTIGAIGGTSACGPCIRYIQGYEMGAKSVNPNIVVNSTYVVSDFSKTAFHDADAGNQFAQQFLAQHAGTDVMFQVAGDTGNGVLQAACAANILGIGVDVDQFLSLNAAANPAYGCIVTSAEKHVEAITDQTIQDIVAGKAKSGDNLYNAANDAVGVSDFHDKASLITPDIQAKLDAATAAMKAGTLQTCPTTPKCGSLK